MAVTKTLLVATYSDLSKLDAMRKAGQVYVDKGTDLADRLADFILRSADVDGWHGKAQTAAGNRADQLAGHARAIGSKFQDIGKAQLVGADAMVEPLRIAEECVTQAEGRKLFPMVVNEDLTVSDPNLEAYRQNWEKLGYSDVAQRVAERVNARARIEARLQEAARNCEDALATCSKAMSEGIQLALDQAPVLAALNQAQAAQDAQDVKDGKPLTPEQRERLRAATSLTKEQQQALANGGDADLPPQQMQYLRDLSRALDGKTPGEIKALADKLGIGPELGNALELAGSEHVTSTLPKLGPDGKPAAYERTKGGVDQLPSKVREAVTQAGAHWEQVGGNNRVPEVQLSVEHGQDLNDLSSILQQSDNQVRQNSSLDGALASRAKEIQHVAANPPKDMFGEPAMVMGKEQSDQVVQNLLRTVAPDHEVVHDQLQGTDGQAFLSDLTHYKWSDGGFAAGELLDQSEGANAGGHQGQLAGESERTVADYFAAHGELNSWGGHTFGETNPDLAQSVAHGLKPYFADMTGSPLATHGDTFGKTPFDTPDAFEKGLSTNAKQVLATLSTDDTAATMLKEAANQEELKLLDKMADAQHNGDRETAKDFLEAAERTRALSDRGLYDGMEAHYKDADEASKHEFATKNAAWDSLKAFVGTGAKAVPGIGTALGVALDAANSPMKAWFLGDSPGAHTPGSAPHENPVVFKGMVAQALLAGHPELAQGNPLVSPDGHILSEEEWKTQVWQNTGSASEPRATTDPRAAYKIALNELLNKVAPGYSDLTDLTQGTYNTTADNNGKPEEKPGK
ncbi:hypothetical protein [Segniliparus rugosus]|uniref:TPR repeat domain-containing protein n=1 Tax=Segniliparus rugosus (strain ATCC BAA-974 / DSM 45345 / CCUG 50838 / CIP 108380 / JCM 13579 / CDC 945) TaxID=679197 RepID=E5XT43_SEGRC|nr:hypothetical protein [Segniliparus rugosus]EFV12454.2 hypothetical protein HMPREF9336_02665 [Segniliparus rugosus ATCC BAA-974]